MNSSIVIPLDAYAGMSLLIALGEEKLTRIAEHMQSKRIPVDVDELLSAFNELSAENGRKGIGVAVAPALMLLSGLRANAHKSQTEFAHLLTTAIKEQNPDWFEANQKGWERISTPLASLLGLKDCSAPSASLDCQVAPLFTLAQCKLIRYDGDEAECWVKLPEYEIPRVGIPSWVLQRHGLKEGDRFFWTMHEGRDILPTDMPCEPVTPQMSPEMRAELEQLLAESRAREAAGEVWEEYTGDGI
jgi:hypothetical protein